MGETDMTEAQWLSRVKKSVEDEDTMQPQPISEMSILRVPKFLVERKKEAYVPQMVSLGPLHHKNTGCSQMEKHKARAVKKMLNRLNGSRDINFIIQQMMMLETPIKNSYEEAIDYSGETLAWMMTMDAYFNQNEGKVVGIPCSTVTENEYKVVGIPCCRPEKDDSLSVLPAKVLNHGGINFKPIATGNGNPNIRFEKYSFSATLFLPTINVADDNEVVLRNLKAFEDWLMPFKEWFMPFEGRQAVPDKRISRYMMLMGDLIDSAQDVALLRKERIIDSGLQSDQEVADFFNDICRGVPRIGIFLKTMENHGSSWGSFGFGDERFPNLSHCCANLLTPLPPAVTLPTPPSMRWEPSMCISPERSCRNSICSCFINLGRAGAAQRAASPQGFLGVKHRLDPFRFLSSEWSEMQCWGSRRMEGGEGIHIHLLSQTLLWFFHRISRLSGYDYGLCLLLPTEKRVQWKETGRENKAHSATPILTILEVSLDLNALL
eukprot:Gb_24807 [translate_table: standard]